MVPVYIGYDPREWAAYRACIRSLTQHPTGLVLQPVNMRLLGALYDRPTERRGNVLWDVISEAPMATEFSLARFWVPHVHGNSGWALYCDCDIIFRAPVQRLFDLCDDRYAAMVVKHDHVPAPSVKMDGQWQTAYPRKNWSSLVLWNCNHPKVRALTPNLLNTVTGLWLHTFHGFNDEDIGALPLEWNWLAGVSPHVDNPQAVHFTLGTPDMPGYETTYGAYGDEWRRHALR